MGDLVQCGPLFDSLRAKAPESHLTLIVLENFVETARRLPMVDEVITFPLDRFVPELEHRQISLADLYVELADFAALLREQHFDCFYNLAHTRLSAALTWLLHSPSTCGLTYDTSGHLLVTHPWINYYFYATLDRTWNPFNLVEMYLPIAESAATRPSLKFRLLPEDEHEATSLLRTQGWKESSPLIAFQTGAADERRRWPISAFITLARQLMETYGAQIVLLGTAEDIERNRKLVDEVAANSILDLTGKTSIGVLAAVLKHCGVLISNDTGTIHLAVAMKTPTVGIYLGPAAAKDTGPYGDNHLILEARLPCAPCSYRVNCAHCACHEAIEPNDVAAAVAWRLRQDRNSLPPSLDWSRIRIRRSQVMKDGQVRLIPLARLPLNRQTLFHSFYRIFWPLLLKNRQFDITTPAQGWAAELIFLNEHYELSDPRDLLTRQDAEGIIMYETIANRANLALTVLNRELTSARPSSNQLREMTLELARCDHQLAQVEQNYSEWAPLAQFIRVLRGNVPDDSLVGLAAACRDIYGALVRGSKLLKTLWIEVTSPQPQEVETAHA
jgi:ADP-heptose:LPS heptosyltransferase